MDFRKGEIIAIDKPYRMSSFGALAHVRYLLSKKLGFKVKIGHAGTLDPLATGVLVLCTGKCTKQIEQLQTHTKEYTATLQLGATTASYDKEHSVNHTYPTKHITRQLVEETLKQFVGEIQQVPPTAGGFTADKRQLAGKQHIDMGIAEEQAVAMISGMAKGGLHPVWTVYSTFIQRTYDQIAQDLCINSNPAVINVVGGGVNSMNDITHICLFDIPMLCSIPGLIYLAPTTCEEYFAMLRWSILQDKKPIAIRVPSNGVVHTSEAVDAEYGYEAKYKVMHQGEKVAVIAAGSFYQKGENVVRLLADKGIDATLINPRYLNEVDAETLDSLKANHQLVVTLEDGSKDGGFGERIASYYGTSEMKVMVGGIRKGLYDRYDVQQLLSDNRLLDEQIVEDVLLVIND